MRYLEKNVERYSIKVKEYVFSKETDKSLKQKIMFNKENDIVVIGGVKVSQRPSSVSMERIVEDLNFKNIVEGFHPDKIETEPNEIIIKKYCETYNEGSTAKKMEKLVDENLIYKVSQYYV